MLKLKILKALQDTLANFFRFPLKIPEKERLYGGISVTFSKKSRGSKSFKVFLSHIIVIFHKYDISHAKATHGTILVSILD